MCTSLPVHRLDLPSCKLLGNNELGHNQLKLARRVHFVRPSLRKARLRQMDPQFAGACMAQDTRLGVSTLVENMAPKGNLSDLLSCQSSTAVLRDTLVPKPVGPLAQSSQNGHARGTLKTSITTNIPKRVPSHLEQTGHADHATHAAKQRVRPESARKLCAHVRRVNR